MNPNSTCLGLAHICPHMVSSPFYVGAEYPFYFKLLSLNANLGGTDPIGGQFSQVSAED